MLLKISKHIKHSFAKDSVGTKNPMIFCKGVFFMAKNSNSIMNPNAREAMNKFKMEAASQVGVNLKQGYNGDLTSREAGSVGGQMVKKMIEAYENGIQ